MNWRVWSVDSITGQKLNMLPCKSFDGERKLNSKGSGSAEVVLTRKLVDELDVKGLTAPVDRTLVLERKAGTSYVPVYAGPVWSRTFNRDTSTLQIRHEDIWSVLSKRFIVDSHTAATAGTPVQIFNVTLATLAKVLVQRATDGGAAFGLPIFYPANVAGSESRTLYGYHLPNALEQLQEVMDAPGGPDVDFAPRWSSSDTLEYVLRVGSLTAGSFEWNTASGRTGASGIQVTEDAAGRASHVWGTGEGSEKKRLMRVASGGPGVALEAQEDFAKETNLTRLQNKADAALAVAASPVEQWSFNILAGGDKPGAPTVTDLQLGGTTRLHFSRDVWIPDGWHENRLIGYSVDLTEQVKLQVQPLGA